jgi:hypothetical protein
MTTTSKNSLAPRWAPEKVVELFGADLRSLAALRIVLAVLVLVDLTNRVFDFYAHYTDAGIMPRTVLLEEVLSRWAVSLNLMNGKPAFQAVVFVATGVAALGMLLGYRTRLMTILVWVLIISIQWRNPLILNSGDVLLRVLLFWGMFLPLGACWSVDRALKREPVQLSMRFISLATVALFMQIAFVYWFTVILKTDPSWRTEGTAIYYALGSGQYATRIGDYLYQYPELLKALTFATIGLEAFGPLLLFCPFFTGPVRTATALAFMNLHIGLWLTMNIGLFSWTAALCMVCFFPTWFWEQAAKLGEAFQGRSSLARRLRLAAAHLANTYLSPVQARLSRMAGAAQPSSGAQPSGAGLGDLTLHPAVTTKTWRGEIRPAARTPDAPETQRGPPGGSGPTILRSSLATNLLALLFLVYVFLWNLAGVSSFNLPERLWPPATTLGLDQYWAMFAPAPPQGDLWHVIPGNLKDGRQVDLLPVAKGDFSLHKLSWAKPPYGRDIYNNERWRKYLENLNNDQLSNQRLYFGQYICREWNARHTGAEQLRTFEITYMWQPTYLDYRQGTPEKVVLWAHSCF